MDMLPEAQGRSLADRIKQARERAGLTQAALAKQIGTSAGSVGQWEIGRSQPLASRLPTLAGALGVPTAWLAGKAASVCRPLSPRAEAGEAPLHLDAALLEEAHTLGVDLPGAFDRHLRQIVVEARQRRWLEENRAALAEANAFMDRHGLCSEGKRPF